uniref:Protein kinase domain-containing protein n=1 Tax=Macrostomum lignano TaxID=282301 RepID=A0A1I8FRR2_9PLAT
ATYGVVYKAAQQPQPEDHGFLKKRSVLECQEEGMPSTAVREVSLLKELAASQHCVLMQEGKLYLVFEYLTMDLKKYLDNQRGRTLIPEKDTQLHVSVVAGLLFWPLPACCPSRPERSRQNILLDERGVIKLADFRTGSRLWRASVRVSGHHEAAPATPAPVDMWSMAAYSPRSAMLASRYFHGDSEIDQLFRRHLPHPRTPTEDTWLGVTSMPEYKQMFPYLQGPPVV